MIARPYVVWLTDAQAREAQAWLYAAVQRAAIEGANPGPGNVLRDALAIPGDGNFHAPAFSLGSPGTRELVTVKALRERMGLAISSAYRWAGEKVTRYEADNTIYLDPLEVEAKMREGNG